MDGNFRNLKKSNGKFSDWLNGSDWSLLVSGVPNWVEFLHSSSDSKLPELAQIPPPLEGKSEQIPADNSHLNQSYWIRSIENPHAQGRIGTPAPISPLPWVGLFAWPNPWIGRQSRKQKRGRWRDAYAFLKSDCQSKVGQEDERESTTDNHNFHHTSIFQISN